MEDKVYARMKEDKVYEWVEEDEDSCSLSHITVVKNVDDLRHISLLG